MKDFQSFVLYVGAWAMLRVIVKLLTVLRMRAEYPQQSAFAEIQTLPNLPLCGSQVVSGNKDTRQVEGGNIENGTIDMDLKIEINQSQAVLPPIAEVQLVDVPLSHQLGDMSNHTGKGTTAKANKDSWKRLVREVGSTGTTENGTRNKWRSCLTPMEDERALKVLINNTGVALAHSATGHDPLPVEVYSSMGRHIVDWGLLMSSFSILSVKLAK
ncbi:hypothetical protein SLEP1_g19064 [Rubroshorea leprosula]|nr:hypothetical protein SLEP1_g19064 [Rubroshorea leprosula]